MTTHPFSSQRTYPIQPYIPVHITLSVIIDVTNSSLFEFYFARASEKDHLGLIRDDLETDHPGLGQRLDSFNFILIEKTSSVVQP